MIFTPPSYRITIILYCFLLVIINNLAQLIKNQERHSVPNKSRPPTKKHNAKTVSHNTYEANLKCLPGIFHPGRQNTNC